MTRFVVSIVGASLASILTLAGVFFIAVDRVSPPHSVPRLSEGLFYFLFFGWPLAAVIAAVVALMVPPIFSSNWSSIRLRWILAVSSIAGMTCIPTAMGVWDDWTSLPVLAIGGFLSGLMGGITFALIARVVLRESEAK